MTVQAVQLNTNSQTDSSQNRTVKSYREASRPVRTKKRVKPLSPQGHLVDDNLASGTKYFFKDIGYDMKSVKDGYLGTANDHELGRLNDVGLRLGGILIATYLASQTQNPKARLMEYIGLAAFLTSMAIYPKLAINTPARILHGYDIDKEYIDDQGRKKSVFQDSNYIPYDMYNGKTEDENLDIIGDRMGIPRDIKNRHDVIREQMRKIATQNNTLWMLTAGFATPLITALLCCGIEKFIVSPGLEKSRNAKYNAQIQSILKKSSSSSIENNALGDSIKSIITKYKGKTIPTEEIENIICLMTQETDYILSEGIKKDIDNILADSRIIKLNKKDLNLIYKNAGNSMQGAKANYILENILPELQDIEELIKEIKPEGDLTKGVELTQEEFNTLKSKIIEQSNKKLKNSGEIAEKHMDYIKSNLNKFQNAFEAEPSAAILSENAGQDLIKFANIIGDFKKKMHILDKCENFKFEHTNETILANNYEKFQKTLMQQLEISPKDYKRMSNDKEFAQKIIDEKFTALAKDEVKYKQTFEKLGKILSDMEISLNGSIENKSQIMDLITAIENVYNNTATNLINNNVGKETADRLVKGNFGNSAGNREELQKLLDGIAENKIPYADSKDINAIRYFAEGKGSSKNLKISRLISRYQGEVNSFFRIFHSLDFYKRAESFENLAQFSSVKDAEYVKKIEFTIKNSLLKGSIADYISKLGVENAYEYKDLYNIGWNENITNATAEAINKSNNTMSERLQNYIKRFRNIIANDTTDFTRPEHAIDKNIARNYADFTRTYEAKFNLVGQSPVDMIQKAAAEMHADRMWLKTVGILTGAIFGVTLLAQFGFGKLKNKQNLQTFDSNKKQMQVKNESYK